MPGHEDDRLFGVVGLDALRDLLASRAWHVEIEEDDIEGFSLHSGECIFTAGSDFGVVTIESQDHFHGLPDDWFIIDNEDIFWVL